MSLEISRSLKFSINGSYGRSEFICRCLEFVRLLPVEDLVRMRLAGYVGWAMTLAEDEKIGWLFQPDGGAVPYVLRGNVCVLPNGKEVSATAFSS